MSEETSNWKIAKFTGKDEDWEYWQHQFISRAVAKGYDGILDGTDHVPNHDETLEKTNEADKEKLKLRELNKQGYSELVALCTGARVPFLMVKKAKSVRLPKGDLQLAWQNLMDRFESSEKADVADVIQEYNDCKMEKGEDPEEWIAKKDTIRLRLQLEYGLKDYTDEMFLNSIIHGLPEEYYATKAVLQKEMQTLLIDHSDSGFVIDIERSGFIGTHV